MCLVGSTSGLAFFSFQCKNLTRIVLRNQPNFMILQKKIISKICCQFKVIPTNFWLKCINLPKYTKFCSTRKLEVADKNFGLLTNNCVMHWQIRGLKDSISGNICVVYICLNL